MRTNYINGQTILTPTEPSELIKGNIYHLDTFSMPPSHIIVKPKMYCDNMETYFNEAIKDGIYPISLIRLDNNFAKWLIAKQSDILIEETEIGYLATIKGFVREVLYLNQVQDMYREVTLKEFII